MIRLMVVDDEQMEREALMQIIHQRFGDRFEVVAEAASGIEAVEQARLYKPDVVFMDIHMPEMDGLEAAEKIKTFSDGIEVVIVTAYSDFDYAKKALKLRALDYIVKPYSINTLKLLLERVEEKLTEARENSAVVQEKDLRIRKLLENVAAEFISILISGHAQTVDRIMEYVQMLDLNYKYYYLYIVPVTEQMASGVKSRMRTALKDDAVKMLVRQQGSKLVGCAFCDSLKALDAHRKGMEHFLEAGHKEFAIGDFEDDLQKLPYAYIAVEKQLHQTELSDDSPKIFSDERKLWEALLMKDIDQAVVLCRKVLTSMYIRNNHDMTRLNVYLAELFGFLIRETAEHMDVTSKAIRRDLRMEFDNSWITFEAAFGHMVKILERLLALMNSEAVKGNTYIIDRVREYLLKHYMEEIVLEDVAVHIGLSKYYLSRIFKEAEGINFRDYLTAIRMEKAKKLLVYSQGTVGSIACSVGYMDPNYFNKAFKKYEGMTPGDYRRQQVR